MSRVYHFERSKLSAPLNCYRVYWYLKNNHHVIFPDIRSIPNRAWSGTSRAVGDSEFVSRGFCVCCNTAGRRNSTTLCDMIDSGDVLLCGGIYNVESGEVVFVESEAPG
jgi:hypothetical protein